MNKDQLAEILTKADSAVAYIQFVSGNVHENIGKNNAKAAAELAGVIQEQLRKLRQLTDI